VFVIVKKMLLVVQTFVGPKSYEVGLTVIAWSTLALSAAETHPPGEVKRSVAAFAPVAYGAEVNTTSAEQLAPGHSVVPQLVAEMLNLLSPASEATTVVAPPALVTVKRCGALGVARPKLKR
jgi:hypothetical protein